MFSSFFASKSRRPSETTPLLAAIGRYRRRHNGDESDHVDHDPGAVAHFDGDGDGDDDEYEDEDEHQHQHQPQRRQRDGPLLPVFSPEILGRRTL